MALSWFLVVLFLFYVRANKGIKEEGYRGEEYFFSAFTSDSSEGEIASWELVSIFSCPHSAMMCKAGIPDLERPVRAGGLAQWSRICLSMHVALGSVFNIVPPHTN